MLIELYFTWLPLNKQQNEIKDKYLLFIMICTCLCVLRMLVATLHLLLCERNSKAPIYVLASVSESTVVSHSLPMVTAIVVWHADAVLASTFDFPAISISLDSLAHSYLMNSYEYERLMNEICKAKSGKKSALILSAKRYETFAFHSISRLLHAKWYSSKGSFGTQ